MCKSTAHLFSRGDYLLMEAFKIISCRILIFKHRVRLYSMAWVFKARWDL